MMLSETDRLTLRTLEKEELPRLVQLLGEWDVARWLSVVPFPYTQKDAEDFYADMKLSADAGQPEFFALALKTDGLLIGGVGLHPPRNANALPGEIEIGYWLGRYYWGRGLASEAAAAVRDIGFARSETRMLGACTALNNHASQKVLRKIGLREQGVVMRDYAALRGENEVMKWALTREEYQRALAQSRLRGACHSPDEQQASDVGTARQVRGVPPSSRAAIRSA